MSELLQRSDKLAFYGIKNGSTTTFHRMRGFTDMTTSKNPKEYTRHYVDEIFDRTDVVGYSPSMSYSFDSFSGDNVHKDIIEITNNESTGSKATRDIVVVNLSDAETGGACPAIKRSFAVVPDSEGAAAEAYTYSGNFKVVSERVPGTAILSADGLTITFTEN